MPHKVLFQVREAVPGTTMAPRCGMRTGTEKLACQEIQLTHLTPWPPPPGDPGHFWELFSASPQCLCQAESLPGILKLQVLSICSVCLSPPPLVKAFISRTSDSSLSQIQPLKDGEGGSCIRIIYHKSQLPTTKTIITRYLLLNLKGQIINKVKRTVMN